MIRRQLCLLAPDPLEVYAQQFGDRFVSTDAHW